MLEVHPTTNILGPYTLHTLHKDYLGVLYKHGIPRKELMDNRLSQSASLYTLYTPSFSRPTFHEQQRIETIIASNCSRRRIRRTQFRNVPRVRHKQRNEQNEKIERRRLEATRIKNETVLDTKT